MSRFLWLPIALLTLGALMAVRPTDPIHLEAFPPCSTDTTSGTGAAGSATSPHMTLVVFDVSSSVIDSGGADPRGRSFEEARILAEALADQPCTPDDRMGAVIFASTAVEVPPIPLTSLSVISSALRRPPESEIGGGTNLVSALQKVEDITDRYRDHVVTVILLSDMRVGDPGAVEAVLADLSGHSLHLVALGDADRSFDDMFSTVTALDQVDKGDVAKALADAITQTRKENQSE